MVADLDVLQDNLTRLLDGKVLSLSKQLHELTLVVRAADLLAVMARLRDDASLRFEQMVDLCGVDYSAYGSDVCEGGAYLKSDVTQEAGLVSAEVDQAGIAPNGASPQTRQARFAVVYHLLSITHNARVRVRVYAEDDELPVLDSVTGIWPSANWYEREAFDLYGIIFVGHSDLRRLLTDYGFVGNPFRKDFPLSGQVEMRYDSVQQRVIYQPVTVEPREITPRIVREEHYGRN